MPNNIKINDIELTKILIAEGTSIRQRLRKYCDYRGIKHTIFARACGLREGFLGLEGKRIKKTTIDSITTLFPDINRTWLLTGNGEMINKAAADETDNLIYEMGITQIPIKTEIAERFSTLLEIIKQEYDIASTKKLSQIIKVSPMVLYGPALNKNDISIKLQKLLKAHFPTISLTWLRTGEGEPFRGSPRLKTNEPEPTDKIKQPTPQTTGLNGLKGLLEYRNHLENRIDDGIFRTTLEKALSIIEEKGISAEDKIRILQNFLKEIIDNTTSNSNK